jgi:hypothetical protein
MVFVFDRCSLLLAVDWLFFSFSLMIMTILFIVSLYLRRPFFLFFLSFCRRLSIKFKRESQPSVNTTKIDRERETNERMNVRLM